MTANPAFHEFNRHRPCTADWNSYHRTTRPDFAWIPESIDPNLSSSDRVENGKKITSNDINNHEATGTKVINGEEWWPNYIEFADTVVNKNEGDQALAGLKSWLQVWRFHDVLVDVDRVARFAIRYGRVPLVEYLVEYENANLTTRDTLDRSSIFYAVQNPDSRMFEYVANLLDDKTVQDEMCHHDAWKATPLFYAASSRTSLTIQNTERCLKSFANLEVRTATVRSTLDLLIERRIFFPLDHTLILTLNGWLIPYLDFPVYLQAGYHVPTLGVLTVDSLQTDSENLTSLLDNVPQESEKKALIWMHTPWTNGLIIHAIFRFIHRRTQRLEEDGMSKSLEHFHDLYFRSFYDPVTVPGDPYLNYRVPTYEPEDENLTEQTSKPSSSLIAFPVLALRQRVDFETVRKGHQNLTDSIQVDLIYHKRVIQTDRTLDETHFPSLDAKVLQSHNDDQVVSRECVTLRNREDATEETKPILMVEQFWIWRWERYIVSAHSFLGKDPDSLLLDHGDESLACSNAQSDSIGDIKKVVDWRNQNLGFWMRLHSENPFVQIGVLLLYIITGFSQPQAYQQYESPLDYFEKGVLRVATSANDYTKENEPETLDIKKEASLMHQIADIRTELAMIDGVLSQQQEIVDSLIKQADAEATQDPLWQKVLRSTKRLEAYRKRVAKIDKDAERIDKVIQDELNLKRTYASIQDARTSMQDARNSLLLGWAVMGFTIITVLFAPIAFMTSLFALPIDQLLKHQVIGTDATGSPAAVYSSNYITWTFFVGEIGALIITGLAILVSLRLRNHFKEPSNAPQGAERKNFAKSAVSGASSTSGVDMCQEKRSLETHGLQRLWRGSKKVAASEV